MFGQLFLCLFTGASMHLPELCATEFLKYPARDYRSPDDRKYVDFTMIHRRLHSLTKRAQENVPRPPTLWFFIVYCYFPPTDGRRSDSSGFLTRFSESNDENCFCSLSSAATTQMATLSALQIDREGQSMRQCIQQGPFSLSHLFPSY